MSAKAGTSSSFFRDNIEAFAVAIAMALVIRHFCLEAFRIPTGSMRPTLLGDERLAGLHGDRILVDKFVYMRRDPRRFEVVVFRYPLNATKNFIKRMIGLPGEWLRIAGGDIWTSRDEGKTWKIARKPAGAREQLLIPYYPRPAHQPDSFQGLENWESGAGWTVREKEATFRVDASDAATELKFKRQILSYEKVDTGGHSNLSSGAVGDVSVAFDIDVERAGELVVAITENGVTHELRLGADKSVAIVGGEKPHTVDLDFKLVAGESVSVMFANVDDELVVELDGDTRTIEFPHSPIEPPSDIEWSDAAGSANGIKLVARGVKATIEDIKIARDVSYDSRGRRGHWAIPEGHFFVLGDNTGSSKDSREWYIASAKLKDGTMIRWEAGRDASEPNVPPNPIAIPYDDEELVTVFRDVNGVTRRFKAGEVEDDDSGVEYPFVPRSHLIGRAFAVFWPIYVPPAYTGPTRVKLIR